MGGPTSRRSSSHQRQLQDASRSDVRNAAVGSSQRRSRFVLFLLVGCCSCVVQASQLPCADALGPLGRPSSAEIAAGRRQWMPSRSSSEEVGRQDAELLRIIAQVLLYCLRVAIPMVWAYLSDLWTGQGRLDLDDDIPRGRRQATVATRALTNGTEAHAAGDGNQSAAGSPYEAVAGPDSPTSQHGRHRGLPATGAGAGQEHTTDSDSGLPPVVEPAAWHRGQSNREELDAACKDLMARVQQGAASEVPDGDPEVGGSSREWTQAEEDAKRKQAEHLGSYAETGVTIDPLLELCDMELEDDFDQQHQDAPAGRDQAQYQRTFLPHHSSSQVSDNGSTNDSLSQGSVDHAAPSNINAQARSIVARMRLPGDLRWRFTVDSESGSSVPSLSGLLAPGTHPDEQSASTAGDVDAADPSLRSVQPYPTGATCDNDEVDELYEQHWPTNEDCPALELEVHLGRSMGGASDDAGLNPRRPEDPSREWDDAFQAAREMRDDNCTASIASCEPWRSVKCTSEAGTSRAPSTATPPGSNAAAAANARSISWIPLALLDRQDAQSVAAGAASFAWGSDPAIALDLDAAHSVRSRAQEEGSSRPQEEGNSRCPPIQGAAVGPAEGGACAAPCGRQQTSQGRRRSANVQQAQSRRLLDRQTRVENQRKRAASDAQAALPASGRGRFQRSAFGGVPARSQGGRARSETQETEAVASTAASQSSGCSDVGDARSDRSPSDLSSDDLSEGDCPHAGREERSAAVVS